MVYDSTRILETSDSFVKRCLSNPETSAGEAFICGLLHFLIITQVETNDRLARLLEKDKA
jgi:hypothetical protein